MLTYLCSNVGSGGRRSGGVTVVQLREKVASTREFLEIAKRVKAITDKVCLAWIAQSSH